MALATLHQSFRNPSLRTTHTGTFNPATSLKRLLAQTMGRILALCTTDKAVAQLESASQSLGRGQTVTIAQPGSQKLTCEAGSLWLTQDGRGKDIVLEAGQEFQCADHDRNARLLAYALSNARWRIG